MKTGLRRPDHSPKWVALTVLADAFQASGIPKSKPRLIAFTWSIWGSSAKAA